MDNGGGGGSLEECGEKKERVERHASRIRESDEIEPTFYCLVNPQLPWKGETAMKLWRNEKCHILCNYELWPDVNGGTSLYCGAFSIVAMIKILYTIILCNIVGGRQYIGKTWNLKLIFNRGVKGFTVVAIFTLKKLFYAFTR